MAYVIAFVMTLSAMPPVAVFGEEADAGEEILLEMPNFAEESFSDESASELASEAWLPAPPLPPGIYGRTGDRDAVDDDFVWDGATVSEDGEITPMADFLPPPIFSVPGGVHATPQTLTITNPIPVETHVRITIDGSEPSVCADVNSVEHGGVYGSWMYWDGTLGQLRYNGGRLDCGCARILPEGMTIPINYVPPGSGDHYSPMTSHGVGRANPGPWNVPWGLRWGYGPDQTRIDTFRAPDQIASGPDPMNAEDSGYTSPLNPLANWTAAPGRVITGPLGGTQPMPPGFNGGLHITGRPDTRPRNYQHTGAGSLPSGGYFLPNSIYNGMVVRAALFDANGRRGRVQTHSYFVNRVGGAAWYQDMNWQGVRILSITMDPLHFIDPITGIYRNWDRGFNDRTPRHWVARNLYNWESQIRAGLWDGRDWYGNPVTAFTTTTATGALTAGQIPAHLADRSIAPPNLEGWGTALVGSIQNNAPPVRIPEISQLVDENPRYFIYVRRHTGTSSCECRTPAGATQVGTYGICTSGRAFTVQEQDGPRQMMNVEMFDESGALVVNQMARGWVFGNWSRFFPMRSLRINFHQGDGEVVNANLIPGTRRHFQAPNEQIDTFRHINARTSDVEGTDLRDPLVQMITHPLRPLIQNTVYSAVFVNGEFWGMYNLHTHRHERLVSEVFDVPAGLVELHNQETFMALGGAHIFYPTGSLRCYTHGRSFATCRDLNATGCDDLRNVGRGIRTDNRIAPLDQFAGARRQALGPDGYARTIPVGFAFPPGHLRYGQAVAGMNHLTEEWFDYLDTIFDMDDLIDYFIIGMHFENWDWISNNIEMWRTSHVIPGNYYADGRWRFIVQDFDNAIFHGVNNFLEYFTAMGSPAHRGHDCPDCMVLPPDDPRPMGHDCQGEPIGVGLPFDILVDSGSWRRDEDASRFFRVLLQNPEFRNRFAARYSTYTGTVFHPARTQRILNEVVGREETMGHHLFRWGLGGASRPMFSTGVTLTNGQPAPGGGTIDWDWGFGVGQGFGGLMAPWLGPQGIYGPARAANWVGRVPGDILGEDAEWGDGRNARWAPHTLFAWSDDPPPYLGTNSETTPPHTPVRFGFPAGTRLRSQSAILMLRAAPEWAAFETHSTTAPGSSERHRHLGSAQNSIDHMRMYFARTPNDRGPVPAIGTIGSPATQAFPPPGTAFGRENLGVATGTDTININWQIQHSGVTNNNAGWLDVGGAHIRRELFEWGDLAAYNNPNVLVTHAGATSPYLAPGFQIGNFSARYVRNMPITVTANPNHGYQFYSWFMNPALRATAEVRDATGTAWIPAPAGTLTAQTIRVTPGLVGGYAYVGAVFGDAPPHPEIHQIYGRSATLDNAVSHSFIELFNPHTAAIDLYGRSLQIQISDGLDAAGNPRPVPEWQVIPLSGSIPAGGSFLVRSTANAHLPFHPTPRLTITSYDISTDIAFSPYNMSVALVGWCPSGTPYLDPLPRDIPFAGLPRLQDLVGTINDTVEHRTYNVWGPHPAPRLGAGSATRRRHTYVNAAGTPIATPVFPLAGNTLATTPRFASTTINTIVNYHDFMEIQFGSKNMGLVDYFRPRYSGDAGWSNITDPVPSAANTRAITLTSATPGAGLQAWPAYARANQVVGIQAVTVPHGFVFVEWTGGLPGSIQNPSSAVDAYFVMPATLPASVPPITAVFQNIGMAEPEIIINQFHGQGGPQQGEAVNAVSHGFIELFNSSDRNINLRGKSLQLRNDNSGPWHVLELPNHIMMPGSSFLVVSREWYNTNDDPTYRHVPRYIIQNWDMRWNLRFSNNSMSVAIVNNTTPLTAPHVALADWPRVLDLVGAVNDPDSNANSNFLGTQPAEGINRSRSVRRRGSAQNTGANFADFERIDFRYPIGYEGRRHTAVASVDENMQHNRGITNERLAQVRPRWSGDTHLRDHVEGRVDGRLPGTVTILNGGVFGAGATPSMGIAPGTRVNISAGFPGIGEELAFLGWSVQEPQGLVLDSVWAAGGFERDLRTTHFVMPPALPGETLGQPVVLVAHWDVPSIEYTSAPSDAIVFTAPPEAIWELSDATLQSTITFSSAGPAGGGTAAGRVFSTSGTATASLESVNNLTLTRGNEPNSTGFLFWLNSLQRGGAPVVLNPSETQRYEVIITGNFPNQITPGDLAFRVDGRNPNVATITPDTFADAAGNFTTRFVIPAAPGEWIGNAADRHLRLATNLPGIGQIINISNIQIFRVTGDRPVATGVAVTPSTIDMVVGQTAPITGRVLPVHAAQVAPTWSTSDASVATVSGGGVVTAVGTGTATITATAGGATGTATVTVGAAATPTSISVVSQAPGGTTTVMAGGTLQLGATVMPVGAPQTVTWETSNPAFATVSSTGVVTAVAAGTVTITARSTVATGVTGTISITVTPAAAPTFVWAMPATHPAIGSGAVPAAFFSQQGGTGSTSYAGGILTRSGRNAGSDGVNFSLANVPGMNRATATYRIYIEGSITGPVSGGAAFRIQNRNSTGGDAGGQRDTLLGAGGTFSYSGVVPSSPVEILRLITNAAGGNAGVNTMTITSIRIYRLPAGATGASAPIDGFSDDSITPFFAGGMFRTHAYSFAPVAGGITNPPADAHEAHTAYRLPNVTFAPPLPPGYSWRWIADASSGLHSPPLSFPGGDSIQSPVGGTARVAVQVVRSGGRPQFHDILIVGGGTGQPAGSPTPRAGRANPFRATAGEEIHLFANPAPDGYRFVRWEASHSITVENYRSGRHAYFTMPSTLTYEQFFQEAVTITAIFGPVASSPNIGHLLINQYFAGGNDGLNAVSHSFVEIRNTSTTATVQLHGYSLQIQSPIDPGEGEIADTVRWEVIPLFGYLTPGQSFLVRSDYGISTMADARVIDHADWTVDYLFSNRGISMAIVADQERLPVQLVHPFVRPDPATDRVGPTPGTGAWNGLLRIVDLVGAENSREDDRDLAPNYLYDTTGNLSRNQGGRRMCFETNVSHANNWNNRRDFNPMRFVDSMHDTLWDAFRPRTTGSPTVNFMPEPAIAPHQITMRVMINGIEVTDMVQLSAINARTDAEDGIASTLQIVNLNAGNAPADTRFDRWEVVTGNVRLDNDRGRTPRFHMAAAPVELVAHFVEMPPPGLIIHHIYGSGDPGNNAISHGFIELYNSSEETINLNDYRLWVQMNPYDGRARGNNVDHWNPNHADFRNPDGAAIAPAWIPVPLVGGASGNSDPILPPRHSFLIVSTATITTSGTNLVHTIPTTRHDAVTTLELSNRNMSVALIRGTAAPPATNVSDLPPATLADLVGGGNDGQPRDRVHNYFVRYRGEHSDDNGISRTRSLRRNWTGVVVQNTMHNRSDFNSVNWTGNRISNSDEYQEYYRPRSRTEGRWPPYWAITITNYPAGNAMGAGPIMGEVGTEIELNAGIRPGYVFLYWTATAGITTAAITNATSRTEATFTMPEAHVYLTAVWEEGDTVLAEFTRTESRALAEGNNYAADDNHFVATGGLQVGVARLTAWNGATQRPIGAQYGPNTLPGVDNRAPIVMEGRGTVTDNPLWLSVGHGTATQSVATAGEATAFQFAFNTLAHENIRFTARQRSTGGGPATFSLAYRIGSTGDWVRIDSSMAPAAQNPDRGNNMASVGLYRTDTYADFNWFDSQTYYNFLLPATLDDQPVVYLRVFMDGSQQTQRAGDTAPVQRATGVGGNTSINDVFITGELTGVIPPITFSPPEVTLDDANLEVGVTVSGPAGGNTAQPMTVTYDTTLPVTIEYSATGTTLMLTATRPTSGSDVAGYFYVYVTREGYTASFRVEVNLSVRELTVEVLAPTGGEGYTITWPGQPASPVPGELVTVTAGTRAGMEFLNWTGVVAPEDLAGFSVSTPAAIDIVASAFATTTPGAMDVVEPFATATWDGVAYLPPGATNLQTIFEMPNHSVVLTGHWNNVDGHVITLNPGIPVLGGTAATFVDPTDATRDVPTGGQIGGDLGELPLPRMVDMANIPPGWRFAGWYTATHERVRYNFVPTASEMTITARWVYVGEGFLLGATNGNGRRTSAEVTQIARWLVNAQADRLNPNESPWLGGWYDADNNPPGHPDNGSPPNLMGYTNGVANPQNVAASRNRFFAADINGDGEVCAQDVILFAQWLVGHRIHDRLYDYRHLAIN